MERATHAGASRRRAKSDYPSESTPSSSKSPSSALKKFECADVEECRELISRYMSEIRNLRDTIEIEKRNRYSKSEPMDVGNQDVQDVIHEEMTPIDEGVHGWETGQMGGESLEDMLKSAQYVVPETLAEASPPKALTSPIRKPHTLDPIEVEVDQPSYCSTTDPNLLAVNGPSSSAGPETNVEKAAKQEASVMARVAELRRQGMWTASLLPLCVEPPRNKTHWDYLLEEVVWMAHDFKQERRLKKDMARKISREIARGFRDKEREVEQGIEREKKEARKMCAAVAKMIREFWVNADKVVDFNARSILEAKKRRALDKHLSFIVGEADKISSMVQEGLMEEKLSRTPSVCSKEDMDDVEFEVDDSESDDETTIAKEEKQINTEEVKGEVNELAKESNMEIDDLLDSLPPEYLEALGLQPALPSSTKEQPSITHQNNVDSDSESVSLEGPSIKRPRTDEQMEKENDENEEEQVLEEKLKIEGNGDGRGVLEHVDYAKLNSENSDERQTELDNIAEEALKFQPKGFTLETTQVKTQVPFLIRGKLREYQMVGLDWLVTLYEKNLNGILADEMGLGKTIQTIALLAHLACSESIWGPHLIIVPTSVILNWEMEFKKWCPALKILTYFGSVKERAEKRKGWTKPNSFHVCITSYKTVTTDIRSFKMKAWQYMILDEAQNIKNWKSQRWQALLNVRARRRLLLTGTPLQNSLMELWSLMHFLMPAIFSSHDDFKDWFSNPLTGMMEGNMEFHAPLVQRLHKVLRPFILRRLKAEVEKQLPSKTEHIVKCPLSKRQRYLYDDFMSRRSTRDNLRSGNMMSVLNIVMQLRKCCNHPNLFEPRPVIAPFAFRQTRIVLPGLVMDLCGEDAKIDDQKHIPEAFDLRKRMTGWSTGVKSRRPLIQELNDYQSSISPPKIDGFKFIRPAFDEFPTNRQSVRGADIPEEVQQGGNAPPLVPRPAAIAPIAPYQSSPGTANDNNLTAVPNSRHQGVVYGQNSTRPVNIHSPFQASLVVNKVGSIVNPQSSEGGFHNRMQATGNRVNPMRYVCSPPMKRKKKEPKPLVYGEYKELVSSNVLSRLQEHRTDQLERARERFAQVHSPFYPNELLSILWKETRVESRPMDDLKWRWNGWNAKREEIDDRLCGQVEEMSSRFVNYVHRSTCKPIRLSVTAGRPSYSLQKELFRREASRLWADKEHPVVDRILISNRLQFPELRLIEYDCGKLQMLGNLLRELFLYKHRCLIFTQMSRMLDVLQAFLSFHGYQYFRLDGTTPIEQRQAMMERFNADSKIFCFILSTRSGGVGVNLTGADTVVFYDSDWNPTMDAQAQDRCHRIGQTRNVSIYRLISERTIEENILKKANQKKRLGEMAIDDAGFTPEFFKKSDNIRDLFDGADLDGDVPTEINAPKDQRELEKAMASLEDEQDVVAARLLTAEAKADRAEFDDTNKIGALGADEPPDEKYLELIQQMAPIERYAVRFLEEEYKPDFLEELKEAEEMIEQKKTDWMNTQKAIEQEEDECGDPLTYAGGSLLDEFVWDEPGFLDQFMPEWMPPTPPDSDDDLYNESHWDAFYEKEIMGEARLPAEIHEPHKLLFKHMTPVKTDIDAPGPLTDSSSLYNLEDMGCDSPIPDSEQCSMAAQTPPTQYMDYDVTSHHLSEIQPTTFVEYPQPIRKDPVNTILDDALEVMKRSSMSSNNQKNRSGINSRTGPTKMGMRAPMTPPPPDREEIDYEGPEWSIIEDNALLNAIKNEQRLTHAAGSQRPGLKVNWEYVSGYVNRVTGFYRSPRQCCLRYQNAVCPREEGRLYTIDPITKKNKKITLSAAELIHLRKGRETTLQQYENDVGQILHGRVWNKMKMIRTLALKRPRPFRRQTDLTKAETLGAGVPVEQDLKLQEMGITYTATHLPSQLLEIKEEKRSQMLEASRLKEQHQQQQMTAALQVEEKKGVGETWGRETSICVRPPAVPCAVGLLTARSNLVIDIPPSQRPTLPVQAVQQHSDLRSQQDHLPGIPSSMAPRRVALGTSGSQHIAVQQGANYAVVVNSQDNSPSVNRMATFVQRQDPSGQPSAVYRTIAPVPQQSKRTPPATPAPRMPVGSYLAQASSSGQSAVYTQNDMQVVRSGALPTAVRQQSSAQSQQGQQRLVQRVSQGARMYIPQPQSGERTFVMPSQQQPRMVVQRLPQKRPVGTKPSHSQQVSVMIPPRQSSSTVAQLRGVARYPSQQSGGTRVMNVVTMPSVQRSEGGQMQSRTAPQYAPIQVTSGVPRSMHSTSAVVRQLNTGSLSAQGRVSSPHGGGGLPPGIQAQAMHQTQQQQHQSLQQQHIQGMRREANGLQQTSQQQQPQMQPQQQHQHSAQSSPHPSVSHVSSNSDGQHQQQGGGSGQEQQH